MGTKTGHSKTDIEWQNRTLCSDESCIGTIGKDGSCKECGKPYEGILPESFSEDYPQDIVQETETPVIEPEPVKEAPPIENGEKADAPDDLDWEKRTLCSDESCIGVIGDDGCCKECGKPYVA